MHKHVLKTNSNLRVIKGDIRVCTHPDFQGKGIGSFMIKELTKI